MSSKDGEEEWTHLEVDDLSRVLGSRETGITSDEAAERLQEYGLNRIEERKKVRTSYTTYNIGDIRDRSRPSVAPLTIPLLI
jgi:magnesium-transporting ATPase (P-type)